VHPAVELKRLRLKFPGEESLLFRDLSVTVGRGEKVLLLGPSGCGKSTLLQVLSGLIPGTVEVPMKAESRVIPASWGMVFQDPDAQFCMPYVDEEIAFVLENLRVPREEMPKRIRELLGRVGLDLPDPHVPIGTLSGGMKQRLAIASVLALEPDVLFLDEPTAMLDPEGTREVWEVIKRVARDKTVLIVEHKIDHVLDFVERILLFDTEGRIIADGPKETVFERHKEEICRYGIWHPGVWDEYLAKHGYRFRDGRPGDELIRLQEFRGYRKREAKITIPAAGVRAGEWIAVTGKNGAGKSTLLHALMRFIRTSGDYRIGGIPAERIGKLTDHLTFVFQNPEFQFVERTVHDEIAFGLRLEGLPEEEVNERVEELLELFRLKEKERHHPCQLSMGQKRRLSVAASIVRRQPVLLLDEPTFGQDAENTFRLLELLEALRRQGTVILMATHDERIAAHVATRVWVIEDGRLVKDVRRPPGERAENGAEREEEPCLLNLR
jgi:energy-coupling factor transport system ATP-binding protein